MSFTDKLKLIIDVDSTGATSGLAGLKTKMSEADGFFGKLKAGAGGLKDAFGSLSPAAAGGLAAGGITAIGGAAFAAVSKFAGLGVEVGDFADKTGESTQESSRWVEVAGDMGISVEGLEGVLGKMNKNLDPDKWKQYGIAIATAKDGTTDVNATFLNAIDHLHGVTDATERAKEGAALFGKGWATVSELVSEGADTVKAKLADVADVKILNPGDVAQAREFRDVMAKLKDEGEEIVLTFGKALLPAVTSVVEKAGALAGVLGEVITLLTKIGAFGEANPIKFDEQGPKRAALMKMSLDQLNAAYKAGTITVGEFNQATRDQFDADHSSIVDLSSVVDRLSGSLNNGTGGLKNFGGASLEARDNAYDLAQATKTLALTADGIETARHSMQGLADTAPEVAGLNGAIGDLADKSDDAATAASALDQALTKLFGGTMDLKEGERAYIASVQDLTKSLKANKGSFDDNTQAGRDNKDAIDKSIGTIKDQSVAMEKQGFTTQEVTDYINGHVASLVKQSSQSAATRAKVQDYINTLGLTPAEVATAVKLAGDEAAKQKIQDFQGKLDGIPPEKATEIQALIDAGSYQEAAAQLEVLTRNRTMTLSIQAKGGAGVFDVVPRGGNRNEGATGGIVTRPTFALIGEKGPEAVVPLNKTPGSSPLPNGGGGGGDTFIYNVRVAPTGRELAQAKARARRRGFAA